MNSKLPISLCMIVKNEQKHLRACLESVAGFVDEMIVVDTGSDDDTISIAESMGARVFHHTWNDDFAEARNVSIKHATNPWILQLDADEMLVAGGDKWFFDSYPWAGYRGYRITINNLANEEFDEVFLSHQLIRFFKNEPHVRYKNRIHENINLPASGPTIGVADTIIIHKGYGDPSTADRRKERNHKLLMQELEEYPDDPKTLAYVAQHYTSIGEIGKSQEYAQKALDKGVQFPLDTICLRTRFNYLCRPEHKDEFESLVDQVDISEFPEILFFRGLLAHRERNMDDAAKYYQDFIGRVNDLTKEARSQMVSNDNIRNAYLNLATKFAQARENLQVIEYLQKAADISPTFYKLKADLGERYIKVGNLPKAFETFKVFEAQLKQLGSKEEKETWLPICEKVLDQLAHHAS